LTNSPIYTDGTNVGIGTANPGVRLQVAGNVIIDPITPNTGIAVGTDIYNEASFMGSGNSTGEYIGLILWNCNTTAVNTKAATIKFQTYDSNPSRRDIARISGLMNDVSSSNYKGSLIFSTANNATPQERIRIDNYGNVGIGTTTPGGSSTVGTKVLSLANGTEPSGGVDGQISLFSKDVSNSAELFVMDEAGNKTQLSPHPTDFLDTLPVANRPFPWAYHSENEYLGKRIKVDLAGLVAAVEQLTGKKFMFIEDIPQRSWDEDQEAQRLAREKEIQNALQQIADLEQKIAAEEDEEKKQGLVKQKEAIVMPEPYVKKDPPKWLKDRIVIAKEATA